MKSIFEFWPEILSRIRETKSIFLALDFDGVLSPIVARPDLAELPPATHQLLRNLIVCPRVRISVISGRSLADVRRHIALPGIVYAGNHGAEIDANGLAMAHGVAEGYRESLVKMWDQLNELFGGWAGVLFEDKGLGVGVHYREIDPAGIAEFHTRFGIWAKKLPAGLEIVHAKKMYEVRPKGAWNKGNAVWHIWHAVAPLALPICIGDDLTDEDGFRALLGKGINIYVGEERQSYAEYILHSQADVAIFLERLLKAMENGDS